MVRLSVDWKKLSRLTEHKYICWGWRVVNVVDVESAEWRARQSHPLDIRPAFPVHRGCATLRESAKTKQKKSTRLILFRLHVITRCNEELLLPLIFTELLPAATLVIRFPFLRSLLYDNFQRILPRLLLRGKRREGRASLRTYWITFKVEKYGTRITDNMQNT